MFYSWAALAFMVGLVLFILGWTAHSLHQRRERQQVMTRWKCPDKTCPRSYVHARELVTHIMDVHPNLAHLTRSRLELK